MTLKCIACGENAEEHCALDGKSYKKCSFVFEGDRGRWATPKVSEQPKFGAASQYVVARLDEISEGIVRLATAIELLSIGRRS